MVAGRARARKLLLEREREQQVIERAITASASGSGAFVVLEGDAGIGKTSLLAMAAEMAHEQGVVPFEACGSVLEQQFAFGIVRQLFERPMHSAGDDGRRELLAGAASLAAPLLGLGDAMAARSAAADGIYAAQHGLYWLAANLAARAPAVIIIDDVQWADEASLRWLHYLLRRLDGTRIAVIVARRLGEFASNIPLLDELRAVPDSQLVALAALSEPAAVVLTREVLGSEPAGLFVRACREMTGGNPFLLHELLGTLAGAGVVPEAAQEARVRALRPAAVIDEVKRRLATLPSACGELARAVAVLDTDAELRHVAGLAGLEVTSVEMPVDSLIRARILEPGLVLRFRHPILRSAVYADIPPGRRSGAHREAAQLLSREPGGLERAAVHLMCVAPAGDRWVTDQLVSAAERAVSRGAPEEAIALLERARREPAGGPKLALALGRATRLAGRYVDAARSFREALDGLPAGAARDDVARELAVVLTAQGAALEAVAVLDGRIADAPRDARKRRLRLEADRAWIGLATDAIRRETAERLEMLGRSLTGDSAAEHVLLGALAALRAYDARGTAAEVAALAERALADGRLLHEQTPEMFTYAWTAQVLLQCDRDDLATGHLEAGLAAARRAGAGPTAGILQLALGRVAMHRGEVAEAEEAALIARELVAHHYAQHSICALLVTALTERGALEAAERALAEEQLDHGALPPIAIGQTLLAVRVGLRIAQSRLTEAAADAEQLLERLVDKGHGGLRLRSTAALAMLAVNDQARAQELARRELAVAQRWRAPSAIGAAQRVLGLAIGGDEGLRLLRQSTETLVHTSCRLEFAKALTDLGAALRRAKRRREARTELSQALDLAHRCRADALVARARVELRACGARPRRLVLSGVDSLTPSERRVAELASRGLSNPEVAQALFVTRRTVETHLSSVYRKLDIQSRDQLAAALGATQSSPQRSGRRFGPPFEAEQRLAHSQTPSATTLT